MGETVYVAVNSNLGVEESPYHTDESCHMLQQAKEYRAREVEQVPNRRECRLCAGEWDPYDGVDEIFSCEYCSKEFRTRNGLSRHILSRHPEVVEAALEDDEQNDPPEVRV